MKILLIHNEYRFTGGEDIAVKNEIELLSPHHNVRVLNFENNFKGLFFQIISFFININFNSISKLKKNLIRLTQILLIFTTHGSKHLMQFLINLKSKIYQFL